LHKAAGPANVFPVFAQVHDIRQEEPENPEEESIAEHRIDPKIKESLLTPALTRWPQHSIQQETSSGSVSSTPTVLSKFPGMAQTDFSPPDPTIAVGPGHVIIAVNRIFAIYSKNGTRLFQTAMKIWFGNLPDAGSSAFFDPRLIYDQYSGHYLILCDAIRVRDGRSWYFLAISRNSDPLGQWAFYELDMQLNGKHRAQITADFPGIGLDPAALYLTGNMFAAGGKFVYGKIRVIPKKQLYSFGAIQWFDFWNMIDATGVPAKNIQPAHCFGNTPVGYLANTHESKGDLFSLWKVSKRVSAKPILTLTGVSVSPYLIPPNAVQKGGGPRISTNDSGLTSAVFRNGSLFTAQALAFNWGSGTVSAIRFYEISKTGNVVQEITYGADGKYYFFPDVMADTSGNVTLIFNRCSPSEFAGIYFTGRKVTDPPGTLQSAHRLHAGRANYRDPNPNGLDPWGDFNGIALDPSDSSVWLFSEYVKSATDWATQVGRVAFLQP